MAERTVAIGAQFRKADCPSLVFEVVETISSCGQAHVRVSRVGWPDDRRVYSVGALTDPHFFLPEEIAPRDGTPANGTPANGMPVNGTPANGASAGGTDCASPAEDAGQAAGASPAEDASPAERASDDPETKCSGTGDDLVDLSEIPDIDVR